MRTSGIRLCSKVLWLGLVAVALWFTSNHVSRVAGGGPKRTSRLVFSHVGVVTTEKKPGERFVEATRVWVTDFEKHPFHVEWLRFEPDSPVQGSIREMPHVAYKVDSIKEASQGMKELLAPFDAGIAVVGFYQSDDGAVIEFMEMKQQP
jgi:hypothetical protein